MFYDKPVGFENFPQEHHPGFGPYMGFVLDVIDGDTLYILIDHGFNTYSVQSIRIKALDAPEIYTGDEQEQQRGYAARDHAELLIESCNGCVLVDSEKWSRSFGRYVARVHLALPNQEPVSFAAQMVNAGHGTWADHH